VMFDVDIDGDLDMIMGTADGPNYLFVNTFNDTVPSSSFKRLPNDPSYAFISTPSELVTDEVSIGYTLFDDESDPCRIVVQYSLDDENWSEASLGQGGDGLTDLVSSKNGVSHTIVWNAEEDGVDGDNVSLRILVHSLPTKTGSIQWPYTIATSSHFPVDTLAPSPPSGVHVGGSIGCYITIHWFHPPEDDVTSYRFLLNESGAASGGPYDIVAEVSSNLQSYQFVDLLEDTTYYFVMQALDPTYISTYSQEINFTTFHFNRPPVVSAPMLTITMEEDGFEEKAIDLNQVFFDPDGDELYYYIDSSENLSCTITRENFLQIGSAPQWHGNEVVTITCSDRSFTVQDSLDVTVTSVNDPPSLNAVPTLYATEDIWYNYTFKGSDEADGDPVTFSIDIIDKIPRLTEGENLFFDTATGNLSFLPDQGMVGSHILNLSISDGKEGGLMWTSIDLIVSNVNDAPVPVVISPTDGSQFDNLATIVFDALATLDFDLAPGEKLSFRWSSNISGVIGTGPVITESLSQPGTHLITLQVSDETFTSEITFSIIITLSPSADRDLDGIPDFIELIFGLDPLDARDAFIDSDNDGYSNIAEHENGTDMNDPSDSPITETLSDPTDTDDISTEMIAFIVMIGIALVATLVFAIQSVKLRRKQTYASSPQADTTQEPGGPISCPLCDKEMTPPSSGDRYVCECGGVAYRKGLSFTQTDTQQEIPITPPPPTLTPSETPTPLPTLSPTPAPGPLPAPTPAPSLVPTSPPPSLLPSPAPTPTQDPTTTTAPTPEVIAKQGSSEGSEGGELP